MEIKDIKSKLTLSTVLHHYNLKPDKNLRLNCPFHEDKSPSLQVYYKTHTAYCFSSNCKTHGKSLDVIDFIMYKENVTKAEAILKAQSLTGELIPQKQKLSQEPIKQATQPSISRELILLNLFTYFKNAIHNSPPAREYLQSRNLNPLKIEIGYNTGQFHHGARRDEILINNCVHVGLLYPWGVNNKRPELQAYKPFAKFGVCFAMRNKGNHITGLYFRSTVNDNNAKHYYLKESTGLYPKYPNAETEKLIICESIIDCASLLQIESIANNYTLLASYGTNRLNEEIQNAIKELPNLKELIFAFDNDDAGNTAVTKYAEDLKKLLPNIIISKLELPCKDVNETLIAHNEDVFTHLLEKRINLFSFSNEKENTDPTQNTELSKLSQPKELSKLNTQNPHKLTYTSDTATYLIKGGVDKVMSKLNVTLEIINEKLSEHINKIRFSKLDLYDSKQVEKVIIDTNEKLQLHQSILEKDIYQLTEYLDEHREAQLASDTSLPFGEVGGAAPYQLTTLERNKALELANDTNLINTIKEKLTHTGIVGEEENKTFLFVIAVSHIQENPLNALIQGSSGSGKTNLLKGIYKIIPDENKKIYSRCSEKMLYNVPKYYFKNKLICFEDVDGLGEEAEYAWRELVSNGELISGVSYKDEKGNIGIKELIVYGPITSIACTTHGAIYADNMSRLFLIAIDESKEQTKKINDYQAKEAAGLIHKQEQKNNQNELKNFVRLLQPYNVHNPHATKLKLPEGIRDERRLYRLYLYFIDMITVLHQYQRNKTPQGKLIATKQDCQLAKDLLFECIMLKMDELDGSLRQFFERLKDYVSKQNNNNYEFTQKEIREILQLKKTSLSYYINQLMSFEYLQQVGSHINKGNRYKILYFDDYRKMREDVKEFLQKQLDALID
jgi:DNA primase/ABC-type dipeptide/oligopeptide/nickel transport system ATPase component